MGGLTVLRALAARLPQETFVYLGDTARLPYGTKSAETVQAYALQATRLLIAEGVKMVVIACNTASAVALAPLAKALAPVPVIGVIEPGARAAVAATRNRRIAVIATEGTVKGEAYPRAIRALTGEMERGAAALPGVRRARRGGLDGFLGHGRRGEALSRLAVRGGGGA